MYFVIESTPDGLSINAIESLSKLYLDEYNKGFVMQKDLQYMPDVEGYNSYYISRSDLEEGKALIIKGELIVPKQKQVVTEWTE